MKILVDTSVWIDFFNGISSLSKIALHNLLETEEDICISEYILTEILQGFKDDKEFESAKRHLLNFPVCGLKVPESYIHAARLYRACRKKGVTIRKTADCLIAQSAIEHGLFLLHNDSDFDRIASICNLRIFPT
ncbi:MAG: PIN domain nuclease [Desulfobacterales bacterium]